MVMFGAMIIAFSYDKFIPASNRFLFSAIAAKVSDIIFDFRLPTATFAT
jgi:hypothetical protein